MRRNVAGRRKVAHKTGAADDGGMKVDLVAPEWDEDETTERLVPVQGVVPHMLMADGHFALCTYAIPGASADSRTEVVRPGQIVPQTVMSGQYEFVRGVVFRLL
jgi:hypothetical protein